MAKVDLDVSLEFVKDFSHWVSNMIDDTKGESQSKVAQYIGISQQSLSNRILGKVQWSLREFFAIQDYFGKEFKRKKEEKKDEND